MSSSRFCDTTAVVSTPALVVDESALQHNLHVMTQALPGRRLRPHVKAFKCTALASRISEQGHHAFTCATIREVAGMLDAGLGEDLLLANESVDVELLAGVTSRPGRVTVAVDSRETITAAKNGGVREVLIDVNVGLPRCGCDPEEAVGLAAEARAQGIIVRGVMGYEGHLMMVMDPEEKSRRVADSMAILTQAARLVGGDVVSAGGTGTYDTNRAATEIQAGSYILMDTQYAKLNSPFQQALWVEASVISINRAGGWIVADSGLKSLGMDHGDPHWPHGEVMFCSDEHVTLKPQDMSAWSVGDHVRLAPAHVDPTVAKHECMWLIVGDKLTGWAIDLRHW